MVFSILFNCYIFLLIGRNLFNAISGSDFANPGYNHTHEMNSPARFDPCHGILGDSLRRMQGNNSSHLRRRRLFN